MSIIHVRDADPSQVRVWWDANSVITLGEYTYCHDGFMVYPYLTGTKLNIGRFCSIAAAVTFHLGGNHQLGWGTTFPFGNMHNHIFGDDVKADSYSKGEIVIGNDVWIAEGVTVMSGVTIGDGAVIAAKALIVKDVRPYEVVGGNPARHIRFRFEPEIVELMQELRWWGLPKEDVISIRENLCRQPERADLIELIERFKNTPRI